MAVDGHPALPVSCNRYIGCPEFSAGVDYWFFSAETKRGAANEPFDGRVAELNRWETATGFLLIGTWQTAKPLLGMSQLGHEKRAYPAVNG